MIDPPERLELLGALATQEPVQRMVVEARPVGSEQGVLVPLAPGERDLRTAGMPQAPADAQRIVRMLEGVVRLARYSVEQRMEPAQRRALPGLVGSEDDVEARVACAQIERLTAERTERR